LGLCNEHATGQQLVTGHERAGVVLVVVEKVYGNVHSAKKVEKGGVGIERAECVYRVNLLHGYVPWGQLAARLVNGCEFQGVVLAGHPPGVEEVVVFFHNLPRLVLPLLMLKLLLYYANY